ncbi:MAG: ABC transporter permease subunit [Candidatus Hodarchaeota archaeon]
MVHVYLKNLRKSWLTGLVPPLIVVGFVGLIAATFPSMVKVILDRVYTLTDPVTGQIYQAILGDIGLEGLGFTWEAALFLYGGGTMNIIILFVTLFIPARLLSTEIDKNTLDVMLSYPIPRWRYLLEKFCVYLTYSLLFPISLIVLMIGSTAVMNILYPEGFSYEVPQTGTVIPGEYKINTNLVLSYSISIFLLLFALGAISLLCATVFLDSNKSITAAGALILTQYFLESLGGLLTGLSDSFNSIQFFSLFHYFKVGNLKNDGILSASLSFNDLLFIPDIFIVVGVGIIALIGALTIFHKREFAI